MFGWLQRHRRVEHNPCSGLHPPAAPKARERVMTPDEIRWWWLASDQVGEPFGSIFKLLLLTGARLNEVAGMSREELGDDGAIWNLPGSRTKNKRPHRVPLSDAARQIIARANPTGLLFSTNGHTAPSGWSRATTRLRREMLKVARAERGAGVNIPELRLHDARRSVVTGMAELGIRPDIIELAVNHVSGARGGIAGVYNRSEMLAERREALKRWAKHVAGIVEQRPANVTALRRPAAQ
jgi:integrase